MSGTEFTLGQRWISNTEPDLGLGIVLGVKDRLVDISFPAAEERRTYAMNQAPLTRVRFAVGDSVTTADEDAVIILDLEENDGFIIYLVQTETGEQIPLPELELNSFIQFSSPLDRLFTAQIDHPNQFQLRVDTLSNLHERQVTSVQGLLGPRVQLLPHQLYIAHEVATRHAPRVLLADEVGLGKTIEAGLIMHQQLLTGRANRILVVVPDSLVHQWLVEMLRRFNQRFTLLDEDRCQGIEESQPGNPFDSAQLVLCTLSFIQQPARLEQACTADWDILCVDEAHHLHWQEDNPSDEYQAIELLAARTPGLLLLTATPNQLGIESHFARLRLLDPDRYPSLAQFIAEEAEYAPINTFVQQLLSEAGHSLHENPALFAQAQQYLSPTRVEQLSKVLESDSSIDVIEAELLDAVHELLDHHGTGRVLFRNTRAAVKGFPTRCLNTYPLALPDIYTNALADELVPNITNHLYPERLVSANIESSSLEDWPAEDPRVKWLHEFLKANRQEKVLLICAKAATAQTLEAYLSLRKGVPSSVFHEGMSLVERDRSAAYFADEEDGAQLLVCSEIGSEGRNFQFAHHLVLFDLPLNPDLLEQRIGRLDRIGQTQNIQIHVPYFSDTAQATLLRWYHEGVNGFEQICPAGQEIFQHFEEHLLTALQSPTEAHTASLIKETQEFTQQLLAKLEQGRDRLLEINSCNQRKAALIIEQMQTASNQQGLEDYMNQAFDQYGVDQQHHSADTIIIQPGEQMRGHFPYMPEDGMTLTFSRDKALSRDDIDFLTWEHPMVLETLDMIATSEKGNTALCTIKLPPLKAGTFLLEMVYTLHCPAPKGVQLTRYLPVTPLRFLFDQKQKNLANAITSAQLTQLGSRVKRGPAQNLIKHLRDTIKAFSEHGQMLAEEQLVTQVAEARHNIETNMGKEISRLQTLAKINPNIRQAEIDYLEQTQANMLEYLALAKVKLDCIRVFITT